jgi:hypothetical protein
MDVDSFLVSLSFSLVEIIPKGIHFDARYFCSIILSIFLQGRPAATPEDRRQTS